MRNSRSGLSLFCVAVALGASGCGAAVEPNVLGTWRTSGMSATVAIGGQNYMGVITGTLVFSGLPSAGTFVDTSTLALPTGGCSINFTGNGTFTDTALTYSARYTGGSFSVTGCTDASQNVAMTALTPADVNAVNAGLVGATASLTATTLPFRWFNNALVYTRA
ncbi:MAG: hypothetical protein U0325_05115 [Polyangiales bacterium]